MVCCSEVTVSELLIIPPLNLYFASEADRPLKQELEPLATLLARDIRYGT